MQTLDFGAFQTENPYWYEDVDTICPFCNGSGDVSCRNTKDLLIAQEKCALVKEAIEEHKEACKEKNAQDLADKCVNQCNPMSNEIRDCAICSYWVEDFSVEDVCDNCDAEIECEECTEGYFEIMWNTAFGVDLRYRGDWKEKKKLAWELGFLLIRLRDEDWLLMGCCGLDYTWGIHYTRWKLQGYLDTEDINSCLSSGGYVFVSQEQKEEMCNYFKKTIQTPESYVDQYERDLKKIDMIVLDRSEQQV